jgi:hypothetical protein
LDQNRQHLLVRSIGAFHGQAIQFNAQTRDFRVNGRSTRPNINSNRPAQNARTHVLQCDDQTEDANVDGGDYFAPGDIFQGNTGAGSNQIWEMADHLHDMGILGPEVVTYDINTGAVVQGGNPGGGRESANFGAGNSLPPVDLSTQGFPMDP